MILKKHQVQLPLHNDVYRIEYVLIKDVMGLSYPLMPVSPEDMDALQRKNRAAEGQPKFWSHETGKLTLHPRPEKDYPNFEVCYLPHPRHLGEESSGPDETSFSPPIRGTSR